MGIFSWIIVGLIAGWLSGVVMKGSGYGMLGDILIGIAGALVGGYLSVTFFNTSSPVNGIDVGTIFVAFLGAVILIAGIRLLPGRSPV